MPNPAIRFLIQHPELPSSRVRVLDLISILREHNLDISVETYPVGLPNKIRCFRALRQYDAVVVQKKLPSPGESFLLRKACKQLVYDFDDAVYLHHENQQTRNHFSRRIKFRCITAQAHLVIAGNATLAEAARPQNHNVAILPSAVPVTNIPQRDHATPNPRCVIGWVGGAINLCHLQRLQPILARLHRKHDFELRILCSEPIDMDPVPITFVPWSLAQQHAEIARFDIGVMPLPTGEHANAKCGYKALQYMAAAVPPIVTDTPTNRNIVAHQTEGFVASTDPAFEQYLETLITNPQLRRKMGQAARQKAKTHYSREVIAQQLAQLVSAPQSHG